MKKKKKVKWHALMLYTETMPTTDVKYPSSDFSLPYCSMSFTPSLQKGIQCQATGRGNVKELDWKEYTNLDYGFISHVGNANVTI